MKLIINIFLTCLLNLFSSCTQEEPETQDLPPEIVVTKPTGAGANVATNSIVQLSVLFRDDHGLKNITINNSVLKISVDSLLEEVIDFTYEASILLDAQPGAYKVDVTAEDSKGQSTKESFVITILESNVVTVTVNPSRKFQTIQNFGASDAWSTQFVGKNWPLSKREEMAELLFSTEADQFGHPKGIGLTSWRFNIGAGSAEQGASSNISDEWRRAESFLTADGTYNWDQQAGQVWFLKKAVENGVKDLIGFVNSPPVNYTKNNKAYSEDGNSSNLKPEFYDDYAVFLHNVWKNMSDVHGINLNYISPVNEPQWEWECCNQEGSPWNNQELSQVVKKTDSVFTKHGTGAIIDITEAGSIDFLYSDDQSTSRGNQVEAFFDPSSNQFVGDLPNLSHHISAHSYFTTYDLSRLRTARESLRAKILATNENLSYWMSEYTILENNEEIVGNGRDLGIDPALYMARVIHADLVYANASAWQWWLAISPYDYKDGLIYIDKNKTDGTYYTSKLLWGLGNFSRFIRPGMKRIAVDRSDQISENENLQGLMQSAFWSEDQIVVVFVNYGSASKEIKLEVNDESFESVQVYQTSTAKNLSFVREYSSEENILISGRSITTCVLK